MLYTPFRFDLSRSSRRLEGILIEVGSCHTARLVAFTLNPGFLVIFFLVNFLFSGLLRTIEFLLSPFSVLFVSAREVSIGRQCFRSACNSYVNGLFVITRIAGIEPTRAILKTAVLPLNYIPIYMCMLTKLSSRRTHGTCTLFG